MAFYGPTWNNANRVMPDSAKRKVNIAIYGTDRHDHTPSPVRAPAALARCAVSGTSGPPACSRRSLFSRCSRRRAQEDKAEQLVSALREHTGAPSVANSFSLVLCFACATGLVSRLRWAPSVRRRCAHV